VSPTVNVSSASTVVSPLTTTVIVLADSPALKCSDVEAMAVKSDGAVAEPLTVE
jgi:hypothetical protein